MPDNAVVRKRKYFRILKIPQSIRMTPKFVKLLEQGARAKGMTKTHYIEQALSVAFEKDGINPA